MEGSAEVHLRRRRGNYEIEISKINRNGSDKEYLYVKNIQGDILSIYSADGKKLVSYVYDAWGNIISTTYSNGGATTAARFNPFTYRGYYRDSETGMYYLNSRYYNPKIGRFISADEIINGNGDMLRYNLYAYCSNNPVMYTDLSGQGIRTWIKNRWDDIKRTTKKLMSM